MELESLDKMLDPCGLGAVLASHEACITMPVLGPDSERRQTPHPSKTGKEGSTDICTSLFADAFGEAQNPIHSNNYGNPELLAFDTLIFAAEAPDIFPENIFTVTTEIPALSPTGNVSDPLQHGNLTSFSQEAWPLRNSPQPNEAKPLSDDIPIFPSTFVDEAFHLSSPPKHSSVDGDTPTCGVSPTSIFNQVPAAHAGAFPFNVDACAPVPFEPPQPETHHMPTFQQYYSSNKNDNHMGSCEDHSTQPLSQSSNGLFDQMQRSTVLSHPLSHATDDVRVFSEILDANFVDFRTTSSEANLNSDVLPKPLVSTEATLQPNRKHPPIGSNRSIACISASILDPASKQNEKASNPSNSSSPTNQQALLSTTFPNPFLTPHLSIHGTGLFNVKTAKERTDTQLSVLPPIGHVLPDSIGFTPKPSTRACVMDESSEKQKDSSKTRAERNRESARRSRERQRKRELEQKDDISAKKSRNREFKTFFEAEYNKYRPVINAVEQRYGKDRSHQLIPAVYEALADVQNVMNKCEWTFPVNREENGMCKRRRT